MNSGRRTVPGTGRRRAGAWPRRLLTAMAAGLLALAGTTVASAPAAATPPGDKDVTAVLFQWRWPSVAQACQDTLGPAGYGWVQVSPPNEHVQGDQWWTSYQPVSYRLESKLGTRAEFAAMVSTCRDAGVEVIVDAVINHMSGKPEGGHGVAGSPFSYYDYPGIYQAQDFNDCRRDIRTYQDRWEVQHCNLVGLADLRTGSEHVRDRIATYLNDLISLGVRGLRIDAAKHMPAQDVQAIVDRLSRDDVYVVQEVIGAAGEPIRPQEYVGAGDVHEFDYGRHLKRMFTNERLADLRTFGESWGMLPSDRAGVFVDNHDTERNGETLDHTDGSAYTLANVFMLAWPYGSPAVHSGYAFGGDYDRGAPTGGDVTCYADGWRCQHDWQEIRGMVGFRNAVGDAAVSHWWSDGDDAIAFGRGSAGYVVINQAGGTLSRTFGSSLPAGRYCDVTSGAPTPYGCSGTTVTVGDDGSFSAEVGAQDALAIHVDAPAGGNGNDDDGNGNGDDDGSVARLTWGVEASTWWGQDVRVVGDHPALGSWDPAAGARLSSATYPVWRGEVALPPGTRVEYKYVKVDGDGNAQWESGGNRVATVPASGALRLDDTWRS